MDAYYVLTNAALAQGRYETAHEFAQQASALAKAINDRWSQAYILSDLGNIERALENYVQAKYHYQASLAIWETFEDSGGKVAVLNYLGQIAIFQQDYDEAQQLFQQALTLYSQTNDKGGLATALSGMGMADCGLGDYSSAASHFQQALQIAAAIQFIPRTLSILIGIGALLLQTGRTELGLELLALAQHHPAGDRETKDQAKRLLDDSEPQVPVDIFETAIGRGQAARLDDVIPGVLAQLSAPIPDGESPPANRRGLPSPPPTPRTNPR